MDKEEKKRQTYREMADNQIRGLISMMNIESFLAAEDVSNRDASIISRAHTKVS